MMIVRGLMWDLLRIVLAFIPLLIELLLDELSAYYFVNTQESRICMSFSDLELCSFDLAALKSLVLSKILLNIGLSPSKNSSKLCSLPLYMLLKIEVKSLCLELLVNSSCSLRSRKFFSSLNSRYHLRKSRSSQKLPLAIFRSRGLDLLLNSYLYFHKQKREKKSYNKVYVSIVGRSLFSL